MNIPLIIHKNLQKIHTPSMLPSIPPLKDDEEDVSYDVKSLTNKYSNRRNNQLYH